MQQSVKGQYHGKFAFDYFISFLLLTRIIQCGNNLLILEITEMLL